MGMHNWSEDVHEIVSDVLDRANAARYEINTSVRGAETGCKTTSELAEFFRALARDCENVADELDELEEDLEESHTRRGRMISEESEDYYSYTIPEWTLPYIINNDPSGLEDDEIEAVDNFVNSLPKGGIIDVDEDENGNIQTFFSHTNDLPGKHGKLGNTCVDVKVAVF